MIISIISADKVFFPGNKLFGLVDLVASDLEVKTS